MRYPQVLAAVLMCVAVRAFSLGSVYVTLNPGDLIDLSPGPVSFGTHPVLLLPTGNPGEFRAAASGHTQVRVGTGRRLRTLLVFVTPTPSRQVGRWDLEWYRTQYGAGPSDCGPALVSMSILWARGADVPVRTIRAEIGYPIANGATRFDDLHNALARHRITSFMTRVKAVRDLIAVLERGHLALVLVRSGRIPRVKRDPREDLVGRYYDYEGGHYVLVKGYSLDQGYFVVHDPYPADWEDNALRDDDGETMIGKNRYYPARQVFAALKARSVLEVARE